MEGAIRISTCPGQGREISAAKRLASTGTFENEESTDYGCRYSNKGSDCYIGAFDNMRESQNPWRRIYPAAPNAAILQVEGRRAEAEPPIRNNLEIYRREIGDKEALVWSHGREAEWYDLH